MKPSLSRAELLALPPATDLKTLGKAFGISEPVARERHKVGEWAAMGIRVLRLGQQWRVVTADIWQVLGISPAESSGPPIGLPPQRGMVAAGIPSQIPAAQTIASLHPVEDTSDAHRTSNRRR